MPSLELQYADGRVTTSELSRTQPLTIGKQSFNDICVAGDDVGLVGAARVIRDLHIHQLAILDDRHHLHRPPASGAHGVTVAFPDVCKTPAPPEGYEIARVDVVVRLRRKV